jgi:hypothetical protein
MADADDHAASLPLGEKLAASIGLVREGATGAAKAGAVIVPVEHGRRHQGAKIRYLADDGMSFNSHRHRHQRHLHPASGRRPRRASSCVEGSPDVTGKAGSAPKLVAFVMIAYRTSEPPPRAPQTPVARPSSHPA